MKNHKMELTNPFELRKKRLNFTRLIWRFLRLINSKMIDDSLYEYLQLSILQYYKTMNKSPEEIQQSLDYLGYRVGYNLIEKYFFI